ncbi:Uncharacterised protein [Bordetella pertussis]|nr:Uncharacterised protein [Bordetella pertussis]
MSAALALATQLCRAGSWVSLSLLMAACLCF